MNKQNILALALQPAMRVTKSVGIGIVLMLTAAVIAMITLSVASAQRACPGPSATLLVTGLDTGWRVPRAAPSALMVLCTLPKALPAGSRASIRRRGKSRRSPAVCRQRSSASVSVHRWRDRRRVHR